MVKRKKHLKSVLMKKYNMSDIVETVETVKTSLVSYVKDDKIETRNLISTHPW